MYDECMQTETKTLKAETVVVHSLDLYKAFFSKTTPTDLAGQAASHALKLFRELGHITGQAVAQHAIAKARATLRAAGICVVVV